MNNEIDHEESCLTNCEGNHISDAKCSHEGHPCSCPTPAVREEEPHFMHKDGECAACGPIHGLKEEGKSSPQGDWEKKFRKEFYEPEHTTTLCWCGVTNTSENGHLVITHVNQRAKWVAFIRTKIEAARRHVIEYADEVVKAEEAHQLEEKNDFNEGHHHGRRELVEQLKEVFKP